MIADGPGRIKGISQSSLWKAWKSIRGMLRKSTIRDVVDYLEFDIDPDVWIKRLLKQLEMGTYEPRTPSRFTLAKSKGFSRRMTMPAIPDLVLYRAIADYAFRRLKRREHNHVYFERTALKRASDLAAADAEREKDFPNDLWGKLRRVAMDYETHSTRRFRAWLRYSQYRRFLIFKRVYPFIVTTDVTNFFDSILHDRLGECFHSVPLPPRMVGLLFFLLERLSLRDPYSDSRRIGLPVDEFDCSRQLAHLLLFSHDDRITARFGEDAYVRWMDDQHVGVASKAEGLEALATIGHSLARINLTANAGKSRILSITEAKRHFHLDINDTLDNLEGMQRTTTRERKDFASAVNQAWRDAREHEGQGEWEKILKRFYRMAGLAKLRGFRSRAVRDILRHPQLTNRISAYMRATGDTTEYLKFARTVWEHPEQVYPDVNLCVIEGLLMLEPTTEDRTELRRLASAILTRKCQFNGASWCATIAPLLILRYGDRRSLPLLRRCFEGDGDLGSHGIVRSSAIVYASYGLKEFRYVRKVAAQYLTNPLSDLVRLVERIRKYKEVPGSYKHRIRLQLDSVGERTFLDMRGIVAGRLLALNDRKRVQSWLVDKKRELLKDLDSHYDRALLKTLIP